MTAPLLACTHLAAFLLGAWVCYRVVLRYGRRVAEDISREDLMLDGDGNGGEDQARPRRSSRRLAVVSIVASAVVMIIGGQAYLNQRDQDAASRRDDHQRQCVVQWAADFTASTRARIDVNLELRDATVAKDSAVDGVFNVFVLALSPDKPPKHQLEQQFKDALGAYVKARDHLAQVTKDVATTSTENPPPVLDLDCKLPKGAK